VSSWFTRLRRGYPWSPWRLTMITTKARRHKKTLRASAPLWQFAIKETTNDFLEETDMLIPTWSLFP
jgi:hypothetical protein